MAATLIKTIPLMFELIAKKKWGKIVSLLKSKKASRLCEAKDETGLSCLAGAIGHNAPIAVILGMLEVDPSLVTAKDQYDSTALHVACLNGASIDRIELILSRCMDLVKEQDCDQRCALHHAVEYACLYGNDKSPYIDVIQHLCSIAPEMIHLQDDSGDTAVDIVQVVKLEVEEGSSEYGRLQMIYNMLNKVSIEQYQKKKAQWESNGFDVMDYLESEMDCVDCKKTYVSSKSTNTATDRITESTSLTKE